MKLSLLKEELIEKINLASKFNSNKLTSVTSLQGILLKGEKNQLHFFSTNLSQYFHTFLKTEENTSFKVIVEPKKINEFLGLLPPGKVEIEIKDNTIVFEQAKTKGNFPLIKGEDFPLPPQTKAKEERITKEFLMKNLPLVVFTASKDESRPALSGINIGGEEENLYIVATDGFRLSIIKTKKTIDLPTMIIPGDFIGEILRQVGDEKDVLFSYSPEEKMVIFKIKNHEFYSRLIEGEFPPYEKVIPQEKKTTVVLEREELLRNIKLVSVFARDFSNIIICFFNKNELKITPKTQGGEENHASQEIEFKGEEQKVAFNYKFVLDFLNNTTGKKTIVEILRPDAPVVFKEEGNLDFLHIIMPVRIQE